MIRSLARHRQHSRPRVVSFESADEWRAVGGGERRVRALEDSPEVGSSSSGAIVNRRQLLAAAVLTVARADDRCDTDELPVLQETLQCKRRR